jgi:hypothetical protein
MPMFRQSQMPSLAEVDVVDQAVAVVVELVAA